MGLPIPLKNTLCAILSAAYTPHDLREFVQTCYDLAVPLIRKKIHQGKINLDLIGLKESGVVYDCLADLFERGQDGGFPEIRRFFENHVPNFDTSSEEVLTVNLRRLVFGKINNNIIRLYSEADPTLAKILRNIKLALERTGLFEERLRFGETFLAPCNTDLLLHLPPLSFDWLRQEFSRFVLIHDNVPEMVKKLHKIIVEQEEFQRMVTLVTAGLIFKDVYKLSWETEQEVREAAQEPEDGEVSTVIEAVCKKVYTEMYHTYVDRGKRSKKVFDQYMMAVKSALLAEFSKGRSFDASYYDHLRSVMPELTKALYVDEHRTVLEYLAKIAKERVKEEFHKSNL